MSLIPLVSGTGDGPASEALREITAKRGIEANFYRLFANSPGVVRTISPLVWALWNSPDLQRRHLELVILRVGQLTNAPYEWIHHVPMARDAQVTDQQIKDLLTWQVSSAFDDTERLVLAATDGLVTARCIPERILVGLQQVLSDAAITELITAAGLYGLIAGMLRTSAAEPEDWAPVSDEFPFVGTDPAYR